jgi:ABC-type nickel/cobalt efflux system permease component RcnA
MEYTTLYSILSLGFGLGLLHALDADHIMAVSSLAATKSKDEKTWPRLRMLGFCTRWALGHGTTLLSLAILFVFAKIELPPIVPFLAEKLVGCLLIGLGLWIAWNIFKNSIALEMHTHKDDSDNEVVHMHLTTPKTKQHNHQPILIGVTHGLAGSAPVLAIIPATSLANAYLGITYIFIFCIGVIVSMMLFGLFFGHFQNWIAGTSQKLFQISRLIIASVSIGFGTYWLIQ